jgi:hypothetical protein
MSATLVTPKTTSGGEIVRELVNSSDGAGLHFDGSGSIDGTSNLALGSKYSAEFVVNYTGSDGNRLFDVSGDTRFIVEFNRTGFTGKIAGYDSAYYEICDIPDNDVFHLVVTVDGTAVSAYINGNLAGTATKNNSTSIDTVTQWAVGANRTGSGSEFEGTIYRARFWNKVVDAKALFERADVPFADQYGSQTSLVDAGASVFTSGTYSWSAYGSNTIANVGNALEITYVNHASGASNGLRNSSDLTTDLVVGKRYRLTVDAKYTGGSAGSKLQIALAGSNTDFATLTTSLVTYTYEFTTDTATGGVFRMSGMSAGNVVTIDNWYLREIGCVSDYELSANPTQSLTVQDRSTNNVDGTASTSGVTQVQPVVQGNLTSLAVTTSQQAAGVPADGDIVASGTVESSTLKATKVDSTDQLYLERTNSSTGKYYLGAAANSFFIVDDAQSQTRLKIDNNGQVTVNEIAGSATNSTKLEVRSDADGSTSAIRTTNKDVSAGTNQAAGVDFGLSRNSGAFKPQAGQIKVGREADWDASDTNIDSYMAFSTYGDNALDERMRISSTGAVTFTSNATSDQFLLTNADATATSAPDLVLYRNSSSPADDDELGLIQFRGKNSTDQTVNYGSILGTVTDISDTSEDSKLTFYTYKAGTETPTLTLESGIGKFNQGLTIAGANNWSHISSSDNQSVSIADDAQIQIADNEAGAMLIHVYDRGTGYGGLIFASYAGAPIIVADPSGVFAVSDTDNKYCVIKSSSSHDVYFKNRSGVTRQFCILVTAGVLDSF